MIKIFYSSEPEIIFAAAAIVRRHRGETISWRLAYPQLLDEEEELETDIKRRIITLYENNDEDCSAALKQMENNTIYILGIGPSNEREVSDCLNYFNRHNQEIAVWYDNHLWPDGAVAYINQERKILREYPRGESCAKAMLADKIRVPKKWVEAAQAMASPEDLLKNPMAYEYCQALNVALVYSYNLQEDYLSAAFQLIIDELASNTEHELISRFIKHYQAMIKGTASAMDKFVPKKSLFQKSFQKDRPIGYLKLQKDAEFLSLESLAAAGLEKYPWLCVIECRIGGKKRLLFYSDKVNDLTSPLHDYSQLNNFKLIMKAMDVEIARLKETEDESQKGPD